MKNNERNKNAFVVPFLLCGIIFAMTGCGTSTGNYLGGMDGNMYYSDGSRGVDGEGYYGDGTTGPDGAYWDGGYGTLDGVVNYDGTHSMYDNGTYALDNNGMMTTTDGGTDVSEIIHDGLTDAKNSAENFLDRTEDVVTGR